MHFQHLLFLFSLIRNFRAKLGSRLPERIKRICFLACRKNYSLVF